MAGLLVAVVFGSLVGLTLLYLNAKHREAGERAVTRFYEQHVLAAARPKDLAGGAGKDVTLKEALDQAVPQIDEAFAGQPELEAAVRHMLGMTYWYLGKYEAAEPLPERAYQVRLRLFGPNHPDTLTSLHDLAMERWKQGKTEEAIALARQALERRRRVLGPEHEDTLWTQLNLGLFLSDTQEYQEAEEVLCGGSRRMVRTRMARRLAPFAAAFSALALCGLFVPAGAEPHGPATREVVTMNEQQASAFARLALQNIRREYPNKPGDVLNGEDDARGPHVLHPAFYGSFDWHSSVHGHWMLVRLLRRFPHLPEAKEIRAALAEHLTAQNLQTEAASFERPHAQSYERPYGWAWLLKLAEELHEWDDPDARQWSKNLKPLADVIVHRYLTFFPKQTYPIRSGVHPNTAFGLTFAFDYARAVGDKRLQELVVERSRTYFGRDAGVPAAWEPDGADFLSPSLAEADLMRRVLPPAEFPTWFHRFLPDVAKGGPRTLLTPARVTDRRDPQLVHLDGLNLSRAWCMRGIAAALPKDDPARKVLAEAAARHAEAALPHVTSGDYAGEHWLASFAVYLLSTPSPDY